MKNSTKYLLAALLVLLASLTAYNMALHAEFRRGTYKDPLRGFTALSFKNFDEVAVPAASTLTVKVVAGPYAVHVSPDVAEYVHLRQQGRRLEVSASFPARREYLNNRPLLVINCPRLATLHADARYQEAGQPRVDRAFAMGYAVQVQGFRQDSLTVLADHASHVELADNRLAWLRVEAGTSPGSRTSLHVASSNHIAAASFKFNAMSDLELDNTAIAQLRQQFGDSAKVTLTGAALGSALK